MSSTRVTHLQPGPFTRKKMDTPPATASSQNVTLPVIPELYSPDFLDIILPVQQNVVHEPAPTTVPEARNPMMDALQATAHQTFTENGAPAFSSTLSPTLDAFQALRPYAHGPSIPRYLDASWEDDPQLTLRIIWHLRSIHDGKGEREVFYQAFGWLYAKHPRTAITNLPRLIEPLCTHPKGPKARRGGMPHGCWKDLLNIVALAEVDELQPRDEPATFLHAPRGREAVRRAVRRTNAQGIDVTKSGRAHANHARLETKLMEPEFRALYVMVARLFAEKLTQDVSILRQMEEVKHGSEEWWVLSKRLSLIGKWAPTPQGSHDRVTNLSTAICLLLHDAGVFSDLRVAVSRDTPLPALETHILRSYYQRWVLTPLRRTLAVPEPLMSAGRWKEIDYTRVASWCMKTNAVRFYKHDPDGFEAYMVKVESGKKTMNGATLMPHEIVKAVQAVERESTRTQPGLQKLERKVRQMQMRVLEAQWTSLVQRLREAGSLDSALAVCDVSGSMAAQPIQVALALSLVTAQLARPPFSGGFITFSKSPQFLTVDVERNGLARTLGEMVRSEWAMNTDLHAVFVDLLLPLAVRNKVKQEDMIKTLFVFSDMQFDEATEADATAWETNHDAIERAYAEAGYEVPRIVYWDLAAHRGPGMAAVPVTANRKGVALMNGFSPALMKVFVGDANAEEAAEEVEDGWEKVKGESDSEFDPLSIMKKAVSNKSFDGLVVNVTLPTIPELYSPDFLDILLPAKEHVVAVPEPEVVPDPRSPFMDALLATAQHTVTENGAPAYSSTQSPTLDAFQALRPRAHGTNISRYLEAAWEHDPQLTLRIIWHLRSIHDGKGEREVFYQAYGWLYENHPRTAVVNLPRLVEPLCTRPYRTEGLSHGYWKDLLNIVALAELDELSPRTEPATFLHTPVVHPLELRRVLRRPGGDEPTRSERNQANFERLEAKLQEPRFRALYVMVARLFAEKLVQDLALLQQMENVKHGSDEWWVLSKRLSLAGKWAPTPQGSHDRVTNLSTAIGLLLHDAGLSANLRIQVSRDAPLAVLETHILRSYYQRWVLTPLRRTLVVPEPLMSAGRWKEINYSRVPALCMKINTVHFYKHDPEGLEGYMYKVESGKKKISGATLMPHEIVKAVQAVECDHVWGPPALQELKRKIKQMQIRVLEAQWTSLVNRLREAGRLDSALAVCDVSASMAGQPIQVALALSLITAQLAKPPFSGGFITFSRCPQFQTVDVERVGLVRALREMEHSHWDMNTNLHAVFVDLLLPLAIANKVKPEDMIKILFVFSDMQFDEATETTAADAHRSRGVTTKWETNHDAIERAYKEAGYEVPRIVYWDLAQHNEAGMPAIPVTADRKGVALMNGFSPALLKVFMGEADVDDVAIEVDAKPQQEEVVGQDDFDPLSVMQKAVSSKSFDGLVVLD
ncbi:uncharacterized protein B0H18DRAFT_1116569 [Fomitopsis serialis]|uniref:uncharacterized protein n=1 Tax=Fomitopsis serialis TaxID=139415 RepID=UPI0020088378|nr:uncharacterized protein B0H18DRAFT_1116569 [Neoantrodia serialis]KAH9930860.1 hypothetical protein B0H18DRAFT_1116569 [Neoantrodia serialis]